MYNELEDFSDLPDDHIFTPRSLREELLTAAACALAILALVAFAVLFPTPV